MDLSLYRHFTVWFLALPVFVFFEWRHTGFVSYVFPFPVLVLLPGVFLLLAWCIGYLLQRYQAKGASSNIVS